MKIKKKDNCEDCSPFVGSVFSDRPFKKSKQTVARIVLPFVGSIFSDRLFQCGDNVTSHSSPNRSSFLYRQINYQKNGF